MAKAALAKAAKEAEAARAAEEASAKEASAKAAKEQASAKELPRRRRRGARAAKKKEDGEAHALLQELARALLEELVGGLELALEERGPVGAHLVDVLVRIEQGAETGRCCARSVVGRAAAGD